LFHSVSDALQQGASQFEQQAGKLKRKFWLQNLKVCIDMQSSSNIYGGEVKESVKITSLCSLHVHCMLDITDEG
jgi:hypothetical protein